MSLTIKDEDNKIREDNKDNNFTINNYDYSSFKKSSFFPNIK